jgi:hypothetical protein
VVFWVMPPYSLVRDYYEYIVDVDSMYHLTDYTVSEDQNMCLRMQF